MCNLLDTPGSACVVHHAQSLEQYAESMQHLDVDLRQLSRGKFLGQTEVITLGSLRLVRRTCSARYLSHGWFRNSAMLVFQRGSEALSVNGKTIGSGRQVGAAGPIEVLNIFPAGQEILLVEISLDHLGHYLDGSSLEHFRSRLGQAGYVECDPLIQSQVARRLFSLFDELAGSVHPLPSQECWHWGRLVMRILERYVCGDSGVSRSSGSARERTLRRAVHCLLQQPDCNLERLAAGAFASKRSLQYLFRELLDQNVHGFAKVLKLNQVRRELASARTMAPVQEVVWRHGFSNPSRVGREYLALFGETMADTRERCRYRNDALVGYPAGDRSTR